MNSDVLNSHPLRVLVGHEGCDGKAALFRTNEELLQAIIKVMWGGTIEYSDYGQLGEVFKALRDEKYFEIEGGNLRVWTVVESVENYSSSGIVGSSSFADFLTKMVLSMAFQFQERGWFKPSKCADAGTSRDMLKMEKLLALYKVIEGGA